MSSQRHESNNRAGSLMSDAENTPRLPIKLRLKEEARSQRSANKEETSGPQTTSAQQSSTLPRPSKIQGTAIKTKPRIGPAYQAKIPELVTVCKGSVSEKHRETSD